MQGFNYVIQSNEEVSASNTLYYKSTYNTFHFGDGSTRKVAAHTHILTQATSVLCQTAWPNMGIIGFLCEQPSVVGS